MTEIQTNTRNGKIIAIASGKGGVGKTWFSITLAHAMTRMGKKVLLFDGDLGLANVDVQLGLMPERDLNAVIEGKLKMPHVVTHYEDGGFDIIAGQSGTSSLSVMPKENLMEITGQLKDLAQSYDVTIIDLGAGIDRTVRLLAAAADQIVVVTNEEPTALTDAYAFIKLMHMSGLSDAIKIAVNLAPTHKDGERIYSALSKACHNFLKFTPVKAGIIRRDPRVGEAIRKQTPLLTRHPNTEAAVDVEEIAHRVA